MAPRTIQSVIDALVAAVPGAPFASTVDTLKAGDAAQPAVKAAVCFMATGEALERAVNLGANLVITHEPTFYNHLDQTDWLKGDPVYEAKRAFIERHRLVVWRFHDYPHHLKPDGILTGMLQALGWEELTAAGQSSEFVIPPLSLREMAVQLRDRLGIATVRFVGNPDLVCERVALLPAARGAGKQIRALMGGAATVLITGEVAEWETSEYVRDANGAGLPRGLIVLGHAASEEAGMRWLTTWMQALVPDVPFVFVPVRNPFQWV